MRMFLHYLSTFKEYFLFGCCLTLSVLLLATNDNAQIKAIRTMTVASVAFAQDMLSFIPNYFNLQRENKVLRELNLSLSDEVNRLREARLENIRLQQMLLMKEKAEYEYTAARVIGRQFESLRQTITLNVGERQGVHEQMPIVTAAGLVGKVVATSPEYSIGQILMNRDFRTSARLQRDRIDGIAVWEGGTDLILKNVAKTLEVKEGDVIITSEYSTIFPPGIKIGIVRSTEVLPGSLFQSIVITPGVDFHRLEEVFVVRYQPDSARVALERKSGGS